MAKPHSVPFTNLKQEGIEDRMRIYTPVRVDAVQVLELVAGTGSGRKLPRQLSLHSNDEMKQADSSQWGAQWENGVTLSVLDLCVSS